jgi:hypothetical protein
MAALDHAAGWEWERSSKRGYGGARQPLDGRMVYGKAFYNNAKPL